MKTVDDVETTLEAEIREIEALLEQSKFPRIKQSLYALLQQLQTELMTHKLQPTHPRAEHGHAEPEAAVGEAAAPVAMTEQEEKADNGEGHSAPEAGAETVSMEVASEAPSVEKSGEAAAAAAPAAAAAAPAAGAPKSTVPAASAASAAAIAAEGAGLRYIPIESFGWDQGEYNAPTLTVYVTLAGVGAAKDRVSCRFTKTSFDLTVEDLEGRNYRLVKDNLDKDIVPDECKHIVKRDRVLLKLKKAKGEYGYDHWTDLTAKRPRAAGDSNGGGKKADPSAGIMDMMRDMYESGDDNMRRIIGESMSKAYSGQKSEPPAYPSFGGGLGSKDDAFSSGGAGGFGSGLGGMDDFGMDDDNDGLGGAGDL